MRTFDPQLVQLLGKREVDAVFKIFCLDGLGIAKNQCAPELLLDHQWSLWLLAEQRLMSYEPIQYIVHKAWFFGFPFFVDNQVLIPRPETEELVEQLLLNYQSDSEIKILDIGTGSGCIAITLAKKLPKSKVTAWDKSGSALRVAQKNAQNLNASIYLEEVDIFNEKAIEANFKFFDIIISNPPYIPKEESKYMSLSTLKYEPQMALFSPTPLTFYARIIELAKSMLSSTGKIYLEVNEFHAAEINILVIDNGFSTSLLHDLQGKERILICQKI